MRVIHLVFSNSFSLLSHSQQSSTVDLMIRNILLKHAGRYGCRAQTSADTVIAEAELLVRGDYCVAVPVSYANK